MGISLLNHKLDSCLKNGARNDAKHTIWTASVSTLENQKYDIGINCFANLRVEDIRYDVWRVTQASCPRGGGGTCRSGR